MSSFTCWYISKVYLFFGLLDLILAIIFSTSEEIFKDSIALLILLLLFFDHSPLLFKSGKSIISVSNGFSFFDNPGLHPSLERNILSHNETGFSK